MKATITHLYPTTVVQRKSLGRNDERSPESFQSIDYDDVDEYVVRQKANTSQSVNLTQIQKEKQKNQFDKKIYDLNSKKKSFNAQYHNLVYQLVKADEKLAAAFVPEKDLINARQQRNSDVLRFQKDIEARRNREEIYAQKKRELAEKELENCTFTPQTGRKNSTTRDFQTFLEDQKKFVEGKNLNLSLIEQREMMEQNKMFDKAVVVNEKSLQILEQKKLRESSRSASRSKNASFAIFSERIEHINNAMSLQNMAIIEPQSPQAQNQKLNRIFSADAQRKRIFEQQPNYTKQLAKNKQIKQKPETAKPQKDMPKISDKYVIRKFDKEFSQVQIIVADQNKNQWDQQRINLAQFKQFFVHFGMIAEQSATRDCVEANLVKDLWNTITFLRDTKFNAQVEDVKVIIMAVLRVVDGSYLVLDEVREYENVGLINDQGRLCFSAEDFFKIRKKYDLLHKNYLVFAGKLIESSKQQKAEISNQKVQNIQLSQHTQNLAEKYRQRPKISQNREWLERQMEQKQQKELNSCTFKPNVYKSKAVDPYEACQRLYEQRRDFTKRQDKTMVQVDYERNGGECTFVPEKLSAQQPLKPSKKVLSPRQAEFLEKQQQRLQKVKCERERFQTMTERGIYFNKDLKRFDRVQSALTNQKSKQVFQSQPMIQDPDQLDDHFDMNLDQSQPLLYMDVHLGENQQRRITIYPNDNPSQLAEKFCAENSLDQDSQKKLEQLLVTQIELVTTRVAEEDYE